jgi:hypothetical protein
MSGLKPVLNVFGDFLEIFSKRCGAIRGDASGKMIRQSRDIPIIGRRWAGEDGWRQHGGGWDWLG